MDADIRRQVERIHASQTMAVIAVAGGGAQALAWLLGAPGASRTILEAIVPYSSGALADYLGHTPERVASFDTAVDMARAAYDRARHLAPVGYPLVGVGCTASLATDRAKRGSHRSFTAAWTCQAATTYSLTFAKGLRDRQGEDEIVSKLILRALAEASCVAFDLAFELDGRERVEVVRKDHWDPIERLLAGQVKSVTIRPDGSTVADEPVDGGVLPGSFDPFHRGHEGLAAAAARVLQASVTFELSVSNVDKPELEATEVQRRVAQFRGEHTVVLTRVATFLEKASLFPGCTFVIGWDTAARLVEPRYYGGDGSEMRTALNRIGGSGCGFLVAGRTHNGIFRTLDDVAVPAEFQGMFTPIPELAFRDDVSSSEMRSAAHRP